MLNKTPTNQQQHQPPRINCLVFQSSTSNAHWKQVLITPPADLTCNLGCLSQWVWATNLGLSTYLFKCLLCFTGQQQMCSDHRYDAVCDDVYSRPCTRNDQHWLEKQLMNVTEKQNSRVRYVSANWKWLSWNHPGHFWFICTRGVKFDLLVIDNFHSILEKSHLFFSASATVRLCCRRGKALNFWDAVWDLKLQQHDMQCYAHLCCINKYPETFSGFCLVCYWK